ncbi:MAG: hypothetical protein M5R40_00115 [Anaerolineae bacterium]|nr:hypothetical protein [Anaerolineae bacterium]
MVSGALGTMQVGYPKVLYFQPFEMEAYSLTYFGLGAWFTAFGVDIWVGRVYIFALGLASLALVYAAARIAYSRFAAWVAVILGAYALSATNVLRADIGAIFWLAVALLGFVLAVWRGRPWLHLVVGYALGLALDGHPNAYRFGLAFALAYALDYGLLLRERRRFFVYWPLVYLAVGGALGFLTYFLIFATVTHRFLDYAGDPFFGADLAALPGVLLEQLTSALRLTPLLLGAAVAGIVAALWRRRTLWRPRRKRRALDRLLLVALGVSALALASLYGYYRDYYLVQSIPLLALAAANFMRAVETRLPARAPGALALVVALTCAGLLVAQVRAAGSQSYDEALDIADRLRAIVPDDAVFVGPDPLYHRMHDYGGFTEMNTGVLYAEQAGIEEAQAWEEIAPVAVALVRGYPIPPPPALLDYIARHDFTRVRCWSTRQLGGVELYMRAVPDGVTPSGACDDLP